jgi:hypothetical protein
MIVFDLRLGRFDVLVLKEETKRPVWEVCREEPGVLTINTTRFTTIFTNHRRTRQGVTSPS